MLWYSWNPLKSMCKSIFFDNCLTLRVHVIKPLVWCFPLHLCPPAFIYRRDMQMKYRRKSFLTFSCVRCWIISSWKALIVFDTDWSRRFVTCFLHKILQAAFRQMAKVVWFRRLVNNILKLSKLTEYLILFIVKCFWLFSNIKHTSGQII